jgi:L-rhamnose mutarotase
MRVALHTRIRAGRIEEYERAHAEVPPALTEAIRAAGVAGWTIWRSGTDLFHLIDCEDYPATLAYLARQPVNVAWQARMAELLETPHDYTADGGDAALPAIWQL